MKITECLEKYTAAQAELDASIKQYSPDQIALNGAFQIAVRKKGKISLIGAIPIGVFNKNRNTLTWFFNSAKSDSINEALKVKAVGIKNNLPELINPKISFDVDTEKPEFMAGVTKGMPDSNGFIKSQYSLTQLLAISLEIYGGGYVLGIEENNDGKVKIAYVVIKKTLSTIEVQV